MELDDPRVWVLAAFIGFFAFFGRKLWVALINMLDGRSVRIAAELNEAKRIREEAERVLAAYRKREEESMKEAEALLSKARHDAQAMAEAAQKEMQAHLQARTRMAEEKIALAEKQAVDELRAHAADMVVASARKILAERMRDRADDSQISAAIADIGRKLH
ncbi:MAG: ATP F0F1 synthase subunit B [Alphaproteobacteria bacterium]|nr:ATP F0F1 synthase subunit B [Alphaproteobacteria bacterium]